MNVLIIAAHPDDEVLGCGGTIARHAADGDTVRILILGEGATSRDGEQGFLTTKALEENARQVASFLGAQSVDFGRFPDNRFDSIDLLDLVKSIEAVVGKFEPEILYTQSGGDLNIDHAMTYRATLTAVRPMEGCPIRSLYTYEVNSSTEWSFGHFTPAFRPDYFVDVSGVIDRKVQALTMYDSEIRAFPHPRSERGLRVLAERRGMCVGMKAAEAFQTVFCKW